MRSQGRRKRSIAGGLSIYVLGLMATLAWFVFYHFPRTTVEGARPSADGADPVNHYAGSISMPVGTGRSCRHMTFDNNSGGFQDNGVSTCRDDAPGANSTEGRMNAIRNAFQGK